MSTAALHQEAVEIAIEGVGVAIKRSSMPMGFGELTRTQLIKGCTQTFAPGTLSVRVANKSQKPNTKRPPPWLRLRPFVSDVVLCAMQAIMGGSGSGTQTISFVIITLK